MGCEACHGGNADSFEAFRAHQGILNSRNPASPVNRLNIARTCGKCHAGPFVAFQKSRHYALLRGGDDYAPSCVTCHGDVAANLLSPKGLESQCTVCHGPEGVAPRPDHPSDGRLMQEGIAEVRASLRAARDLIARIDDDTRRANLEEAYEQAEVPVIQATQSAHAFVFDDLQERLSIARERAAALLAALVNPGR